MRTLTVFFLMLVTVICCCTKEPEEKPVLPEILSFRFEQLSPVAEGSINQESRTITVKVPKTTDVSYMVPSITVSTGAKVRPSSGAAYNFSEPVIYTVTDTSGKLKTEYTVSVIKVFNEILSVSFQETTPISVTRTENRFDVLVQEVVDITKLTPVIVTDPGTQLVPGSGVTQNFSLPVKYQAISATGDTAEYQIRVIKGGDKNNTITAFRFAEFLETGVISGTQITVDLPYGATGLNNLTPVINWPELATISPDPSTVKDFTQPVAFIVTSQSGLTKEYTVTVNVSTTAPVEVRAAWIAAPQHNLITTSYDNMIRYLNWLDECNFNALYLCAWANNYTAFKSQVLADNSSWATPEDGWMFKGVYSGGSGDPVADLISEAHKRGMKVLFWFEYGFMSRTSGDKILEQNPSWKGIASDGKQSNYNSTDYYYNAFNPAVQDFMIALIEEALTLYPEVDGVQGDDRLPAMPANSGYDDYTVSKYKTEHAGQAPPASYSETQWFQWRINILNEFAVRMHNAVKAKNPNYIVAFSPNPYPFCYDNLMQDWPSWIEDGVVELLSVQCYRNTLSSYQNTVNSTFYYIKQKTSDPIFNPGVLLGTGSMLSADEALLTGILKYNRSVKTNGEAFFYVKWIDQQWVRDVLKKFYITKVPFPDLISYP